MQRLMIEGCANFDWIEQIIIEVGKIISFWVWFA